MPILPMYSISRGRYIRGAIQDHDGPRVFIIIIIIVIMLLIGPFCISFFSVFYNLFTVISRYLKV